MLGSDGELWVVKFCNNPQHVRVLANEFLASRLARSAGLSVPACEIVEVSEWLVENSPELRMETPRASERCRAGLHFGSRVVGGLMPGHSLDYLPEEQLLEVKNLAEFAGMLALDKWTGNANGRQAVFHRRPREKRYTAAFIDQGYCFHAGEWRFADSPLRGVYARNAVYAGIRGWQDFAPWLERMETMPAGEIWRAAEEIPPQWYGGDIADLESLVEKLLARRSRIRELIEDFRGTSRRPFPKWGRQEEKGGRTAWEVPLWARSMDGQKM
jgi:hypothetical protein